MMLVTAAFASASLGQPPSRASAGPASLAADQRLIVNLRVDVLPEGGLSQRAVADQRDRIVTAQDAVIASMTLAGVPAAGVGRFQYIPALSLATDAAGRAFLAASPLVASLEDDIAVPPDLFDSTAIIGASTPGTGAWAQGYTGSGWSVAVLDTGVQGSHPFLTGKVVAEACYSNAAGAGGAVSLCPGGATSSTATGSGVNCSAAVDGCDHGTHVAGIAAGSGGTQPVGAPSPGAPFYGVARGGSIVAIQVFSRFDNDMSCGGVGTAPCVLSFTSDQTRALERVLTLRNGGMQIAAANMSLGGGRFFATCDAANASRKAAIDNLVSVGVATVIASGNNGYSDSMGAPACISTAISVGSTNKVPDTAVSSFSNSASFLTMLAPGASIYSSIPTNSYDYFNGTSMAAPHVAGAWAVIKQKAPTASVAAVRTALTATGDSTTKSGVTKPRIQLDLALGQFSPVTPTPTPVTPTPTPVTPTPTPESCAAPTSCTRTSAVLKGSSGGW